MINRRKFLRTAGTTGLAVTTLPSVINSFSVKALAGGDGRLQQLLEEQDRILIIIQMQGGNDGLNTVVPFTNDKYYSQRPTIAIPRAKALRLTDTLGLHPALAGFRSLFDDGQLAIVQGVVYPNPDRSHFRGTDIWLTATDPDVFGSTGWIGRYLQTKAPNYPTELPEHPLAVQIGSAVSLGLQGTSGPMGIGFRDPDEFFRLVNAGGSREEVPSSAQEDTAVGREVAFMRNIARSADVYARIVKQAADAGSTSGVTYPATDIGQKLRVVSQLIAGGLKTRIYMVSWANNNFDTHANQTSASDSTLGAHATLLRDLGDSVQVFMQDMKLKGHADRVSGMTFSEFGRRVAENGSVGTDHGTAAPLFVFGSKVKGGVIGPDPNLNRLDDRGDLIMDNDFRNVYASVLLQWFGTSASTAQQVLFKDFSSSALPLFEAAPVSVNNENSSSTFLHVGPNPAVDRVVVRTNVGVNATASVSVSDMLGKVVSSAPVESFTGVATLNLAGLSPGRYILTLRSDQSVAHTFLTITR